MNGPRFDSEYEIINNSIREITQLLNLDQLGTIDEDFVAEREKNKNIKTKTRSAAGIKGKELASAAENAISNVSGAGAGFGGLESSQQDSSDETPENSGRSSSKIDPMENQLLPHSLFLKLTTEKALVDAFKKQQQAEQAAEEENGSDGDDDDDDDDDVDDDDEVVVGTKKQLDGKKEFPASKFHPGVTELVLSWWKARNNVHKQIVIFKVSERALRKT